MKKDFNDYFWHDSSLECIKIDRSAERKIDSIAISINWINGYKSTFIFNNVYQADLRLNFGVAGEENILQARINNDDTLFSEFVPIAKFYELKFDLNCFVIETNSSGSTIKILAKNFEEIIL